MKNKKTFLHILFILAAIIIVSFISIKVSSINGDRDYQKLGINLDSYDISYYTVYNKDIFTEYKVYKISNYYESKKVDELKKKLENSDDWSRNKFYEYKMVMFYEKEENKISRIDRENLYYYDKNGINAIFDLKNLKLYYYKGIPFYHTDFNEILGVNIKNYASREIYSVRGGLQYDGMDYYVYNFTEEKGKEIANSLDKNEKWNKNRLEDGKLDNFIYNPEVLTIQNGYYHYELVCRTSYENKKKNFTEEEATGCEIGVYDVDKNILYYYWESI